MKKITLIIMALMLVVFTQCKKTPVEGGNDTDDTPKVKVRCEITINNDGKSDFTNIFKDGSINWSDGWEYVYVAIPNGENSQIVKLKGYALGNVKKLEFEGEVGVGLLKGGEKYDIWYLGNSQNDSDSNCIYENEEDNVITSIKGSIANQTGKLSKVGYYHIAKTSVRAIEQEGEVVLLLNGKFDTKIAVAYMDLSLAGISTLSGNAIVGTEYQLQYSGDDAEGFEFVVNNQSASINIEEDNAGRESYIVLLPNDNENVSINTTIASDSYACKFDSGINAGNIYGSINNPLSLEYTSSIINGYECVDLGLPSGIKWATCNFGAETPNSYGNYYQWGITSTSSSQGYESLYYLKGKDIVEFSGNKNYDVAAWWRESWRMPTSAEMQELIDNCEWVWTSQNGVNGYEVIGTNGNSIFIPAAGVYIQGELVDNEKLGAYWSTVPCADVQTANHLKFTYSEGGVGDSGNPEFYQIYQNPRYYAMPIRPVVGNYLKTEPLVRTDVVIDMTTESAKSGGYVYSSGGDNDVTRGVCWSTSPNPTIADAHTTHTTDESSTATYSSEMTGLSSGTKYYVRAYATNSKGTTYGDNVEFFTYDGEINGHAYVDLGLPSGNKWAVSNVCNTGVTKPEDSGDYYAWGAVAPTESYGADFSVTYSNKEFDFDITGTKYDAAKVNWGETWRMPTAGEVQELIEECTWEIVVYKERKGVKVIGKNGKSIFLPCAGYYSYPDIGNGGLHYKDNWGCYFTSSLAINDSEYKRARALFIYSQSQDNIKLNEHFRYIGCPIRAISK